MRTPLPPLAPACLQQPHATSPSAQQLPGPAGDSAATFESTGSSAAPTCRSCTAAGAASAGARRGEGGGLLPASAPPPPPSLCLRPSFSVTSTPIPYSTSPAMLPCSEGRTEPLPEEAGPAEAAPPPTEPSAPRRGEGRVQCEDCSSARLGPALGSRTSGQLAAQPARSCRAPGTHPPRPPPAALGCWAPAARGACAAGSARAPLRCGSPETWCGCVGVGGWVGVWVDGGGRWCMGSGCLCLEKMGSQLSSKPKQSLA